MNQLPFEFAGCQLAALGSGALWYRDAGLLVVSDLHLGRAERYARTGRGLLPPYEIRDTLNRLSADIAATAPAQVLCLGDSFDDDGAALALDAAIHGEILALQAGRGWVWIAGNHDPAPLALGGSHRQQAQIAGLTFRHAARPGATAEVSGHYHPKATLSRRARGVSRPCFLFDHHRLILPAYGTYTGGLRWTDPALQSLMGPGATGIITGTRPLAFPMPRLEGAKA